MNNLNFLQEKNNSKILSRNNTPNNKIKTQNIENYTLKNNYSSVEFPSNHSSNESQLKKKNKFL